MNNITYEKGFRLSLAVLKQGYPFNHARSNLRRQGRAPRGAGLDAKGFGPTTPLLRESIIPRLWCRDGKATLDDAHSSFNC